MNLRSMVLFALLLSFVVIANAQVVINEILYDTPGSNPDPGCFTELKGTPGTSLSGYWLVGINGSTAAPGPYDSVALVGTIPASGYFVISSDSSVANHNQVSSHVDWQNAGGATSTAGDNLLLKLNGNIVDAVGYGNFVGPDSGADWAGEPSNNRAHSAPDASPPNAIGRIPDGQDSNDNQADFQLITPSPGVANTSSAPTPVARTLAQLRTNNANGIPSDSGTYIITHGIANCSSTSFPVGSTQNVSFQDNQAGVWFRGNAGTFINVGDSLTVRGVVSMFSGLTQISAPNLLVTNNGPRTAPAPYVFDTHQGTGFLASSGGEQFEGMLIQINDAVLGTESWPADSATSVNVTINDGSGAVTLRLNNGVRWDLWTDHPTAGTHVNITGVGAQFCSTSPYTSGYEIQPRAYGDITPVSAANDPKPVAVVNDFRIASSYPNPFNHTTKIRYDVSKGERASMTIFDVTGRQIASLGNNIAAGEHVAYWNGRNDVGQTVSGGMYFVRLSGQTHSSSMKVVYLP